MEASDLFAVLPVYALHLGTPTILTPTILGLYAAHQMSRRLACESTSSYLQSVDRPRCFSPPHKCWLWVESGKAVGRRFNRNVLVYSVFCHHDSGESLSTDRSNGVVTGLRANESEPASSDLLDGRRIGR